MARGSLRLDPRMLWHDDVEQAGRVAIWQAAPGCKALAYAVARRAMIDELRRTQPGGRSIHAGEHAAWDAERDCRATVDTPDALLEAAQALAAMEALAPGWPEALALSDGLAAAGRRLGVSESRACQVRRWLQVSFA